MASTEDIKFCEEIITAMCCWVCNMWRLRRRKRKEKGERHRTKVLHQTGFGHICSKVCSAPLPTAQESRQRRRAEWESDADADKGTGFPEPAEELHTWTWSDHDSMRQTSKSVQARPWPREGRRHAELLAIGIWWLLVSQSYSSGRSHKIGLNGL